MDVQLLITFILLFAKKMSFAFILIKKCKKIAEFRYIKIERYENKLYAIL